MVVRYLEQQVRERHFSSRERELEKSASGAAAAKGTSTRRETAEIAYNGQQKVSALEEISAE